MTSKVTFGREGGRGKGLYAKPLASPAVLVLHEWWGLGGALSNMESVLTRLATAGHAAIAPDLYRGKNAADAEEAQRLADATSWEESKKDVVGSIAELKRRGAEKVVAMGFSFGAGRAARAAVELGNLDGLVLFYGLGSPPPDADRLAVPILGHYAKTDEWVDLEAVRSFERRIGRRGTFHWYDAPHSFCNESLAGKKGDPRIPPGIGFQAAAAELAWHRTFAFLQTLRR